MYDGIFLDHFADTLEAVECACSDDLFGSFRGLSDELWRALLQKKYSHYPRIKSVMPDWPDEELQHCLQETRRVLRPNGRLLAMGPNIRFCFNAYWDFVDHFLPLSDRSMTEAAELADLRIEEVIPRFLPYTMARKRPPSPIFVHLYLRIPMFWRLFGKQFLVVARKANIDIDLHSEN